LPKYLMRDPQRYWCGLARISRRVFMGRSTIACIRALFHTAGMKTTPANRVRLSVSCAIGRLAAIAVVGSIVLITAVGMGGPKKPSKVNQAMSLMNKVWKGDFSMLQAEIDQDFLQYYSRKELGILRNTIFAHYGYAFKTKSLSEHFAKFDWYTPDRKATRAIRKGKLITPEEKKNMELIRAHENARLDKVRNFVWTGKSVIYTEASHVFDVYCFVNGTKVKYVNEGDSGYTRQEKIGTWKEDDLTIIIEWHTEKTIDEGSPPTSRWDTRTLKETQKLDMYEIHHSELGGGWEIANHLHSCK
jgi:hypothetical protein